MKNKLLILSLIVVVILLFYNMMCYGFIKKDLDKKTREVISGYIQDKNYEFINAYMNDQNTIKIFIKSKESYYQFIVDKDNFQVKEINNNVPIYIK